MPTGVSCIWTNPLTCFKPMIGSAAASAVPAAWDAICKSFASAAAGLLKSFANSFASVPDVNPVSAGISSVYGMSLAIAAVVSVLLVFGQVIRTAWTADGSGLAQALAGGAKALAAWLATATVATAALAATNNVTAWIIRQSSKSQAQFAMRMGDIVNWFQTAGGQSPGMKQAGQAGEIASGASLLLIVALVSIVIVIVLWFELLLRGAALSVLIAVSPIPAAGQMSETTKVWWQRTCSAAIQLLILKPVIALVFAVGIAMSGGAKGVEAVLEGLLVLVLAAFSWPVIARFFTFATIQSSSSGLATALGFAAGRMSGGSGNGGPVSGVNPRQWSLGAEQRTMATREGAASSAAGTEGGLTGGAAGAGSAPTAGGGTSGGGGAAVLAGVGWALQQAHNVGNQLAGRMETTAAHAGMHGAYPYSTVGGSGARGQRMRRPRYGQDPGGPAPQPPPADTAGSASRPPEADPAGSSPPPVNQEPASTEAFNTEPVYPDRNAPEPETDASSDGSEGDPS